ncbi:restriction endonuclease subunit S [Thermatribacter velox]|uniref:Restriction endonuclease subunit S n=1 Tax=Thermatribacter velox TaxID=3039681 RepID=A0ABZ2Y7W8_9BACT
MTGGPYKLPEGWRWVRLGEVCEINPRRPRMSRDLEALTSFVPMSAVDDITGTISSAEARAFKDVRKGYTYFEEGDVLFAKITPCMENGKSAVATGLIDGIGFGSTEFHVLRPTDAVISEWVWLFVRREDFRKAAKAAFRGGVGQQRVPAEFLREALIPLPPLSEQRRIVARIEKLMSRIREVRRLREEARKDAERLWQSILTQTLPRPGSDLPSGWRWVKLGEVCQVVMGQSPPSSSYNKDGIGLPFFQGKADFGEIHPTPRVWCTEPKKIAEAGDILISVRAPVGPTNVAESRCCIGRGLAAIRVDSEIESTFLLFYLRSIENMLATSGYGSTFNAITKRELISLKIPLPPLHEQRRIVAHLEAVQEKIHALKAAQAETEEEFKRLEQSILDKAFRGEL